MTALLGAINVTLVVTDVAELGLRCALVARQIGGVSCYRSLPATANIFIEPGRPRAMSARIAETRPLSRDRKRRKN